MKNNWIEIAKNNGDKYILSVHDTVNNTSYPVYFSTIEKFLEKYNDYDFINNQRVIEIIKIYPDGTFKDNLKLFEIL